VRGWRVLTVLSALLLAPLIAFTGVIAWLGHEGPLLAPSVCYGRASGGSLEGGQRLPLSGANYRSYSAAGYVLGRTFLHSSVRDTLRDAYAGVHRERPELRFIYAETSWPWGGRFAPHKTHRNGTSVDFLVPVRTRDGQVTELPTTLANQFGYGTTFDLQGRTATHSIDFDALGMHLLGLAAAAETHGIGLKLVIFDVDLQPLLLATKSGAALRQRIPFNKTQAKMRHDEHYHVDFAVNCQPQR
jgi:penicillin-insensitive murein DD-endopeptidase